MKRKLTATFLALTLIVSLTACGTSKDATAETKPDKTATTTVDKVKDDKTVIEDNEATVDETETKDTTTVADTDVADTDKTKDETEDATDDDTKKPETTTDDKPNGNNNNNNNGNTGNNGGNNNNVTPTPKPQPTPEPAPTPTPTPTPEPTPTPPAPTPAPSNDKVCDGTHCSNNCTHDWQPKYEEQCVKEAWVEEIKEEVPKYEIHKIENSSGLDLTVAYAEYLAGPYDPAYTEFYGGQGHFDWADWTIYYKHQSYHTEQIQVGTEIVTTYVEHEAVYEKVLVGYYCGCAGCKATKGV